MRTLRTVRQVASSAMVLAMIFSLTFSQLIFALPTAQAATYTATWNNQTAFQSGWGGTVGSVNSDGRIATSTVVTANIDTTTQPGLVSLNSGSLAHTLPTEDFTQGPSANGTSYHLNPTNVATSTSIVSGAVAANGDSSLPKTGLVAHWTFDTATIGTGSASNVVYDVSGNTNWGSTAYAPTTGVAGPTNYGEAITLDGSSQFFAANNVGDFTSSNFTLSGRFKFNSISNTPYLFQKGNNSAGYGAYVTTAGAVSFYTRQSSSVAQTTSTAAGQITTGAWYQITFVRNGSSVKIYINGVDKTSSAATHVDPVSYYDPLVVGAYNYYNTYQGTNNYSNYLNGSVDDVLVYNTNLSPANTTALYTYNPGEYTFTHTTALTRNTTNIITNVSASLPSYFTTNYYPVGFAYNSDTNDLYMNVPLPSSYLTDKVFKMQLTAPYTTTDVTSHFPLDGTPHATYVRMAYDPNSQKLFEGLVSAYESEGEIMSLPSYSGLSYLSTLTGALAATSTQVSYDEANGIAYILDKTSNQFKSYNLRTGAVATISGTGISSASTFETYSPFENALYGSGGCCTYGARFNLGTGVTTPTGVNGVYFYAVNNLDGTMFGQNLAAQGSPGVLFSPDRSSGTLLEPTFVALSGANSVSSANPYTSAIDYDPTSTNFYFGGICQSGSCPNGGQLYSYGPASKPVWTNLTAAYQNAMGSSVEIQSLAHSNGKVFFALNSGAVGMISPPPVTQSAISTTIANASFGIQNATITSASASNGQTGSVAYYLSNDNGVTWTATTVGTPVTFANPSGIQLKYRIDLTGDASVSNISIAYNNSNNAGTIQNLKADSSADAAWVNLRWNATLPSNTQIKFRTRGATAAQGLDALYNAIWSDYYVATTTGVSGTAIKANGAGGANSPTYRYLEMQATLISNDGVASPSISSLSAQYSINTPPLFDTTAFGGGSGATSTQITTSSDPDWGKVKIQYRLFDTDDTTFTPSFQYCLSSCSTQASWHNVSGIVDGSGASATLSQSYVGNATTTYTAYWNAAAQIPNNYSTTAQVRVTADDGEAIYHTAVATSSVFTLDTTPPNITTLHIDGSSSSTVSVQASASAAIQDYKITDNADGSYDGLNPGSGGFFATTTPNGTSFSLGTSTVLAANVSPDATAVTFVVRDIYGNVGTSTAVAPLPPGSVDVNDVSSTTPKLLFTWTPYVSAAGATFSSYQVWRSTNGSTWGGSPYATITDPSVNYFLDTSVSTTTIYYYKERTVDTDGDMANYSSVISKQPVVVTGGGGSGGGGNGSETLESPQADQILNTSARIVWTTNSPATSQVDYGTTASYGLTQHSSSYVTTHEVYLTGLTQNTLYHYKVSSTFVDSNTLTDDNKGATYTFTTANIQNPTVATNLATLVTTNSATLNGQITATGGEDASQSGFVYGTDFSMQNPIATTTLGAQTGTATFSSLVTGLTPATTYYVRSYATNSSGTSFGTMSAFTTSASAPVVAASSTTNITRTSATITGVVSATGGSTVSVEGFNYGPDSNYGLTTSFMGNFAAGSFPLDLNNLQCGTTYHFQVFATNGSGTSYSPDQTFSTLSCAFPPSVTTSAATAVATSSVMLNGQVTATGGATVTQSGFAYGTDPTLVSPIATTTQGGQVGAVPFSGSVSGLAAGVNYYFRSYATNSGGTGFGTITSFTTLTAPPTVVVSAPSAVTQTSATLNGAVTATGGDQVTAEGFHYGLTTSYGTTLSAANGPYSVGPFFLDISSALTCGTTYHVQAFATSQDGTAVSPDQTFTTATCASAPTVTTDAVQSPTTDGATFSGQITNTGGDDASDAGFIYSTDFSFHTGVATTSLGVQVGTATFTATVSTLLPGTNYFVRAYARNIAGTSYGSVVPFSTTASMPIVSIFDASNVTQTTATLNGTVTATGGYTVTVEGFNYGVDMGYGSTASSTGSYTVGPFSQHITGLTCGTTYHFEGAATNSSGTAVSGDGTFTTAICANAPTVTTSSVTSFTATTATFDGQITVTGGDDATQSGFVYGTTAALVSNAATTTLGAQVGTASFTQDVSGLTPATTYYVKAYAENAGGTGYGSVTSFVTASAPPTVNTLSASAITGTTTVLNGSVLSINGSTVTSEGFAYGTTTEYTMTSSVTGSFGAGAFHQDLVGLECATLYHFAATASNAIGTSTGADQTFTTGACPVVPIITNVVADQVQNTYARITWTTANALSSSVVNYGTDTTYASTTSSNVYTNTHQMYLTGLTPNTPYYFKVSSADSYGETGTDDNNGAGYTFTTATGPAIAGVTATPVGYDGATITWNTDTLSDSYVFYGTTATDTSSYLTAGSAEATTTHSVSLSGLTASTLYYFYVTSKDADGNTSTDNNAGREYTLTTGDDLTPPNIFNITEPLVDSHNIVVYWQTNKPADTQIEYGTIASTTDGSYTGLTTLDSTLVTAHVATISGLAPGTEYYFRIIATDAAGVRGVSDEQMVQTAASEVIVISPSSGSYSNNAATAAKTTPPTINDITIDPINTFDATVNLKVSAPVRTIIDYGPVASSTDATSTPLYTAGSSALSASTNTSIKLGNLLPGTAYHFIATVIDAYGNTTQSDEKTFTTKFSSEDLGNMSLLKAQDIQSKIEDIIQSALPSINPPFMTDPVVSSTTEDSAVVSWATNVKAYTVLDYGDDASFVAAASSTAYASEASDLQTATTTHSITLTNLKSGTKYHFSTHAFIFPQVVSKSPDHTFSTKSGPITPQVLDVKTDSFRIIWTTGSKTSSSIDFTDRSTGTSQTLKDGTLVTAHDVTATNLISGHTYDVKVYGYDVDGNLVTMIGTVPVTTGVDKTPPVVASLHIDSSLIPGRTDIVQSIVSWKTNKPATSAVYYEEGSGSATQALKNKIENDTGFVEDHVVLVPNLKPATIYRIQVSSTDQAGNVETLPIRTIVTPQQSESIVDIIFKNFSSTFNFIH